MVDKKRKLLIIEDDLGLQRQYKWNFEAYEVLIAGSRAEALEHIIKETPEVITLDLGLPPDPDGTTEGFAILKSVLEKKPHTKIIVASGHEARESAVEAISLGAYDFYQKPIDQEVLGLIVERAFILSDLEKENRQFLDNRPSGIKGLITGSDSMLKICKMVERVANTNITVLLLGASGTGKEIIAKGLHNLSDRKDKAFVAINCGAIPENLLESELFGYEKGAFTGAVKQTKGKIEIANGGTLFLDEIGDIPFSLQVKLLRFLQERVIERIGGRVEIPIDIRIICATHQNLENQIAEGTFREDLFYRVNEIAINIPVLCDRDGDAVLLAQSFLNKFNNELNLSIKGFTGEALSLISSYKWPGNVRELENKIKRAIIMCETKKISVDDLELREDEIELEILNLRMIREKAELKAIKKSLIRSNGNVSQAAKLLGVSRPTFYGLLKHYDIKM